VNSNLKARTLGAAETLTYPDEHRLRFVAGQPARFELGLGMVAVTGEVLFADGSEAWAILELFEDDGAPPEGGRDRRASTELTGVGVFTPDGGTSFDGYEDFLARLGKNAEQVYPYRVRILPPIQQVPMLMLGLDGWSGLRWPAEEDLKLTSI